MVCSSEVASVLPLPDPVRQQLPTEASTVKSFCSCACECGARRINTKNPFVQGYQDDRLSSLTKDCSINTGLHNSGSDNTENVISLQPKAIARNKPMATVMPQIRQKSTLQLPLKLVSSQNVDSEMRTGLRGQKRGMHSTMGHNEVALKPIKQQPHQQLKFNMFSAEIEKWVKYRSDRPFSGNQEVELEAELNSLPPNYHHVIDEYSKVCGYDASKDKSLRRAYHLLEEAHCYYGALSMQEARKKLKHSPEGTYLVRDSSDAQHLFSLSVKTNRGVTAIRIAYCNGLFKLDCEEEMAQKMPAFNCVIKLLQFYSCLTTQSATNNMCVFLESSGRRDTAVVLSKPRVHSVASLKSLTRKTLNGMLNEEQRRKLLLFMPPCVENFMMDYPYAI